MSVYLRIDCFCPVLRFFKTDTAPIMKFGCLHLTGKNHFSRHILARLSGYGRNQFCQQLPCLAMIDGIQMEKVHTPIFIYRRFCLWVGIKKILHHCTFSFFRQTASGYHIIRAIFPVCKKGINDGLVNSVHDSSILQIFHKLILGKQLCSFCGCIKTNDSLQAILFQGQAV